MLQDRFLRDMDTVLSQPVSTAEYHLSGIQRGPYDTITVNDKLRRD
jgi:hypothetical protein